MRFNQKDILTPTEISRLLGVHHGSVTRWCREGDLTAHMTPGGHRRIKVNDLIAFLKKHDRPIPVKLTQNRKLKILIVEDEEIVLDVIINTLQRASAGFELFQSMNGFEAGHKVHEIDPDLVILDIFISGINGIEVCKLIKKEHANTKVIIVTEKGSADIKKKIMAAGADAYFAKPLDFSLLLQTIAELFDKILLVNPVS